MVKYTKATTSDLSELIDFINYVFSANSAPIDFKKHLPSLYADKYDLSHEHFIAKEDDKIKAAVLLHKTEQKVGNETLKIGGIGSVSVHPYSRGKGYMKKLMEMACEEIAKTCDLGTLSGQRQRYGYFDFDTAGIQASFTVNSTNINHCYKAVESNEIMLKTLCESDAELINDCYLLQQKQLFTGVREKERFFDIMRSWDYSLNAIFCGDELLGYVCGDGEYIGELVIENCENIKPIIKKLVEQSPNNKCDFVVNMFDELLLSTLFDVCENYNISCGDNNRYMLCNPRKVIKSYLSLKARTKPLNSGEIVLKIGGDKFVVRVSGETVSVEDSDKEPELSFAPKEALARLFSPMCYVSEKTNSLPFIANEWFALPLFIHPCDRC